MTFFGTETVQKNLQLALELKPAMRRIAFLGNAARIFAHARNLLKMARDPDPIDKHVGKKIRLRRLGPVFS
jgi:hypothetical protein